ncbi:MAG TPA: tellurite resistance TerB family protein [Paracoccaceae bacterium]|nr:tellurite resistance TerB family protein [Paracoccaceae bacterium]
MRNARSLLDSLMGGLSAPGGTPGAGAAGGLGGIARQAQSALSGQSALTKGAIAGGLLGVLLGGKDTRRLAGSALKVGGAALVGGLAYKAWTDWQAGKQAQAAAPDTPVALPAPEGTAFLPSDPGAADDLSTRLLQAMVAAAKADGHVTAMERRRIGTQLDTLGLGPEAQALITDELDAPLDVGRIAGLARTPEEAAEVYAASLLVVDPEAPAEKGYLAMLAARLQLDPGLVSHLHARAADLA